MRTIELWLVHPRKEACVASREWFRDSRAWPRCRTFQHRNDKNPQPLGSVIARAQLKLDIRIADVAPPE